MVGSLQTGSEVRAMAVSSELIYLGCKGGVVEIWDKKHIKVGTLQLGTNCKVNCMALDSNEQILVIGTSDGQIQVTKFSLEVLISNGYILFSFHIAFDPLLQIYNNKRLRVEPTFHTIKVCIFMSCIYQVAVLLCLPNQI